jgi:predicted RNA binding protein YcfA (HicA-like mRNA interferase family)
MPKIHPVHWKLFEKFLLKSGCTLTRREASHRVYWKDGILRPIVLQAKGFVPVFIILNNLRTLRMTRDEYLAILTER